MKIVRFNGGIGNQLFQYAYYKNMQKFDKQTLADITGYEKRKYKQGLELEKVFGIKLNIAKHDEINKLGYNFSLRNEIWKRICTLNCSEIWSEVKRILGIKHHTDKSNEINKKRTDTLANRIWKKLFKVKKTYYKEKVIGFDKMVDGIRDENVYLDGFWQSYKYFSSINTVLQQELQCKAKLSEKSINVIKTIKETNCVAIHIRRTDYLNKKNSHFINLTETSYYNQAIQYINSQISNITFCIFSDDIEWAKNNFALENAIYVDWNQGENSYQDMIIMSYCMGIIMANSTFSWWGAWLNPRNINKCVICPKQWYNVTSIAGREIHTQDLILPEWKTIEIELKKK